MPGMMRSRKSGCRCLDCGGPQIADRAAEKRAVAKWRSEYETAPDNVCQDECPLLHWSCPPNTSHCCTATRVEEG